MSTITGSNRTQIINSPLQSFLITGSNNKIIVQSKIGAFTITGSNNEINGLDQNCLIDNLNVNGSNNIINLNQNC
jgi:hypothetical protein